jgi:hypothetical protein
MARVFCSACRTGKVIDLRTVDRHPLCLHLAAIIAAFAAAVVGAITLIGSVIITNRS